jgi:hypothetical protein
MNPPLLLQVSAFIAERTDGDLDAARQHYRRVAVAGYGDAAHNLGNLLWPSEPEAAVQWLERAAELGVTTANLKLAGILGDSSPAEARRLLQAAAVAGDGDAVLALAYNTYIGVLPGEESDAHRWLEQAVRAGVPDAQELYDQLYADPGELRRRAADGDVQAMYNLGILLLDEDQEAALVWLARAAQLGHVLAMNNLASMLLPEHPEEARMWLERAAATGEPTAIHNLAWLAGEGDDGARRCLERAAEAGEPRAMYELGEMLFSQNRDPGLAWLRRAAEAGDTFAMNSLGIALASDDPEEAERWFRRGAEAGYDKAMFNLASMLVDDRPTEARRWHLAAAESGHTGAMLAMAMYSMEETGPTRPCSSRTASPTHCSTCSASYATRSSGAGTGLNALPAPATRGRPSYLLRRASRNRPACRALTSATGARGAGRPDRRRLGFCTPLTGHDVYGLRRSPSAPTLQG